MQYLCHLYPIIFAIIFQIPQYSLDCRPMFSVWTLDKLTHLLTLPSYSDILYSTYNAPVQLNILHWFSILFRQLQATNHWSMNFPRTVPSLTPEASH